MPKRKGFFNQEIRPEDELARQREVEALIAPRRVNIGDIPLERISPNPFQARRNFDGLHDLVQAIKAQGFTTRLRVRPDPAQPDHFQLVFGERRLRAAREAGLTGVPCEIADHTDDEMIEIGLAENIQRRDLDPLEEAQAFHTFIEQRDYTVRRLAERIGKDKSYVDDRLALLRTPADVQALIQQRPDSIRIAREIAKLDTPAERQPLIDAVIAGNLKTEDVRTIIREVVAEPTSDTTSIESRISEQVERRSDGTPRHQAAPNVHRAMERDVQAIRTVIVRLQQIVPVLDSADRAALSEYLAELRTELDKMAAAVQPQ
ncbi:MAG: ParB/RepB/Spo0J family partition protein [Chloroflexota bacterium]|nr:ParB/RepB/Spo0J family partition protein [Chloroflexota bacterium]